MRRSLPLLALLVTLRAAPAEASFLGRPMDVWLKELKSDRAARRRSAAFALGRMGGAGASAVPDLVDVLEKDPDASVRDMAACAIGDVVRSIDLYKPESAWTGAGKALLAALKKGPDARVRRSAAYAVGAFGELARSAAPELRAALSDPDPSVRQNAAWALGRLGAPSKDVVAGLCDRLGDRNVLVKRDAAGALGALGRSAGREALRRAAAPLLDLVKAKDEDAVVRKAGLAALALVAGAEHRLDAEGLYALLDDKDPDLVRGAAYALGNMGGEPARRALPVLRRALGDPDDSVKALAAATLANAGEAAASAVDDLAAALKECDEPVVRRNCAIALAQLGRAAKPAVPALVGAMKPAGGAAGKHAEEVRVQAAEALAKIRYPANKAALPALRERIRTDANPLVRHHCVWALFGLTEPKELDEYDLRDALVGLLDDKSADVVELRYDTARLLAFVLRKGAPDKVVEVLLEMIGKKDLRVFLGTGASVEGTASEAGGGKTGAASKQGGDARFLAAEALGRLQTKGSENAKVVEALREAAKGSDTRLKVAAKSALKTLGVKDED